MASNVAVTYNFVAGTPAVADNVDQNFTDLVSWINTNAVHLDASKAFTNIPTGPNSDPTTANQLTRKAYVDGKFTSCLSSARPSTPATGAMIFETDKNRVRVYDGSNWLLVSGSMRVSASNTGTVVANATTSTLTFATENYDTDSFFTAGGSTFTVAEAGTYSVTVHMAKTAGNSFTTGFGCYGRVVAPSMTYRMSVSESDYMNGSFSIYFTAGQTFTIQFQNASGGSTTFDTTVTAIRVGD